MTQTGTGAVAGDLGPSTAHRLAGSFGLRTFWALVGLKEKGWRLRVGHPPSNLYCPGEGGWPFKTVAIYHILGLVGKAVTACSVCHTPLTNSPTCIRRKGVSLKTLLSARKKPILFTFPEPSAVTLSFPSMQGFSTGGTFAPEGDTGQHLESYSGNWCVGVGVLLASSDAVTHIGQSTQQRRVWPQTSTVPRLRSLLPAPPLACTVQPRE